MLMFDCAELQSNVDESSVFFNLICSIMFTKVYVNPWPNDYHRKKCAETTAHVCVTQETWVLTLLIVARRLPRCRIYLRRHRSVFVTMGLLVAHHV